MPRAADVPLWRLSVKSTAPYTDLGGEQLIEWGGGLRWLAAGERTDPQRVRLWAAAQGGHATLFRAADKSAGVFQPLDRNAGRRCISKLKAAFDPHGILNRGPALSGILSADAMTMQTNLSAEFRDTPEGREADAILRSCVHCGFCTATCPTYQLLGDELDGPRGRIYLIKQVLEGDPVTAEDAAAPRPLPHLPQLRDDVPVGRAVRPAARHRPRDRRAQGGPHAGGSRAALEPAPRAAVGDRCSAAALSSARMVKGLLPRELGDRIPRRRTRRRVARAAARAQDAADGRLRAARVEAEHRRRGSARSRPHRHLGARACRAAAAAARCRIT